MALSRITEAVASFTDLTIGDDLTLTDDLLLASDAALIKFGADADVIFTHVADTGLLLNSASVIQFRDSAINIGSPADGDLDINADDEIELNSTLIDVNGNLDVSGTIVGASTLSATTITASTAFVPDASDGAALGTTALEFSDLFLADAAVINLGADQDVTITHVADTGVLINGASVVQFRDSAINIGSPADGDLDINADDEIELNSTLIDINGNVEISGTAAIVGIATFTDDIIIGDGKTIGSASDVDAITIGSDGDITLTQDLELQHDGAILSFGANDEIALTHVHDTGLLLTDSGGTPTLQLHNASESVSSDGSKLILTSNGVAFSLPTADGSANQVLATDGSGTLSFATSSANTPSSADGQALGSASLEWSDLFLADGAVINLGADQDVKITHVADTGVLLNAASVIQFRDSAINIGSSADGQLDIAADTEVEITTALVEISADATVGDDLTLKSDAAVLGFGADTDVTLTHVADTGLLLNAASVIQFRDSAINIGSPADGDLDINADDEIELNSTLIDINGNVEISGTAAITGIATFTDDIIIGDGKTIGSASDVDAITIGSDGDVTLTQDLELQHDGAILSFGANDEIALTHVHDTGLLLTDSGGTPTLQLHDSNESIASDGSKVIITSGGTAFSLPTADGSANQVLATNGSAVLSFADNSGGQLIQTVNTTRVDVVSGTTTMPFDDTIPQKTEGVEFLTVAITPTKNDNKLLISVHLQCQMTNNGQWSMALFQDDTADALAASSERDGASDLEIHSLKHFMTTGTTSETTFKIRSASSGSGTITMNSVAGSRKYGGVLSSSITVQEIEV